MKELNVSEDGEIVTIKKKQPNFLLLEKTCVLDQLMVLLSKTSKH